MKPSGLIEGIVIVGMVILIFGGIFVSVAQPDAYNLVIDENFSKSFDKFNQTYNLTLGMQDKLDSTGSNVSASGSDSNIVTGGANVLNMIFNAGSIIITLVNEIALLLGIPVFIVTGIIILILAGIVFAITRAIFQTVL